MALRELLLKLGVDVDEKGVKNADNALAGIKKAAVGLAAVFVTGQLARGVGKILDLGSAADETSNVIQAVFEKNSDAVEDWATRQADAMGRSRFELREMAAATGAIVGPTLGSADAAAEMATQVSQLAVDLGSFFNATDKDALVALQAGLIGSSEPMLKFGVTMNVAALEAFRLEKGITTAFNKMSAAEKQQTRFNFIMEKTAQAQGDAAKTAGGYANQTKALRAAAVDSLTILGQKLLPTFEKITAILIPLTKQVGAGLAVAFDVLEVAISAVVNIAETMIGVWEELDADSKKLVSKLGALGLAFILLGNKAAKSGIKTALAWALPIAGILLLLLAIDDFIVFMKGGDSVIGRLIKRFKEFVKEAGGVKEAFVGFFSDLLGVSKKKVSEIITVIQGIWFAIKETGSAIASFVEAVIGTAVIAVEDTIAKVKAAIEEITGSIQDLKAFATGGQTRADKAEEDLENVISRNETKQDFAIKQARFDFAKADAEEEAKFQMALKKSAKTVANLGSGGVSSITPPSSASGFNPVGAQNNSRSQNVTINSPVSVNVDASNQTNPDAIGGKVATSVSRSQKQINRQMRQNFVSAAAK